MWVKNLNLQISWGMQKLIDIFLNIINILKMVFLNITDMKELIFLVKEYQALKKQKRNGLLYIVLSMVLL